MSNPSFLKPAFLPELVSFRGHDDFQTLGIADHERHRLRLGIHLGAHIGPEIIDDLVRTCHKTSDRCHRLGESSDVEVNLVHAAEFL